MNVYPADVWLTACQLVATRRNEAAFHAWRNVCRHRENGDLVAALFWIEVATAALEWFPAAADLAAGASRGITVRLPSAAGR